MAEIGAYEPSYDYSSIGSVGGEAAQSVNGTMINKIRAAEEEATVLPIVEDIENIALEAEKMEEIKSKVTELNDVVEYFDLFSEENVFNQYHFDVTGSSAVFDAVDMANIDPGAVSVNISQMAQKDVYQSKTFDGIDLNAAMTSWQDSADNLEISIGSADAHTFEAFKEDGSAKTYSEFIQDINDVDGIQASWESVGTNESDESIYRLVIKSTEEGMQNSLTIKQNGTMDLGYLDTDAKELTSSSSITPADVIIADNSDGLDDSGMLTLNGIDFNIDEGVTTYQQLVNSIDSHDDFNASINENNKVVITKTDGSEVQIDTNDTGLTFDSTNLTNHLLKAQNLQATVDGVDYDVSSNELTFQNGIKMTALKEDEEGESSSVSISRDTSAISIAIETMLTKYNELVDMIDTELNDTSSVIEDKDSLRTIMSDVKNILFSNYGAKDPEFGSEVDDENDTVLAHSNVTNNDKSMFLFGVELDKSGHLSLNTDTLNSILSGEDENYDFEDIQGVFTGAYENKGLGVQLNEYIDNMYTYEGTFSNYESNMESREEELEKDKEEELERLNSKYGIMAQQFSAYSALISQMEQSFSGLKMMIEQSYSDS